MLDVPRASRGDPMESDEGGAGEVCGFDRVSVVVEVEEEEEELGVGDEEEEDEE